MILVQNKQVAGGILLQSADPAVRTAGEMLADYMQKISGARFSFCENEENPVAFRLCVDQSLGEEELLCYAEDGVVTVSGGSGRAVIYGVVAFLESLGCVFYAQDCEKIPQTDTVELADDFSLRDAPAMEYRDLYWSCSYAPEISVKLRVNGSVNREHRNLTPEWGGGVTYAGPQFVHTFECLVPAEEFFEDHPEYFSEIDGQRTAKHLYSQLCMTNEDVYHIVLSRLRNWLNENPEAKIVSLSQNDSFVINSYCTCPSCRRIIEEEGSPMGPLICFVNRVAEALEPDYPEVAVDTLAYQYSIPAPRLTAPRRNVIVRFCTGACAAHSIRNCERYRGMHDSLVAWGKICHRMYIWDYTTDFAHYLTPFPNIDYLADHVRFFYENGARGMFMQGMYQNGLPGGFGELRCYLLAKLLWNPTVEQRPLEEDFCRAYYGEAAEDVLAYLDLMHRLVASDGRHFTLVMAPSAIFEGLIDDAMLGQIDALWQSALQKVAEKPEFLAHVRRSGLTWRYYKLDAKRGEFADAQTFEAEKSRFFADCAALGVERINEGADIPPVEVS